MKKLSLFAVCLLSLTAAWAQEVSISQTPSGSALTLAAEGKAAAIVVSSNDAEVVKTVAACLSSDVKAVTGLSPQVKNSISSGDQPIIAGTLGQSTWIDRLAGEGKIDASSVEGKWETYGLQMVENPVSGISRALVVYGSTPRGTAYGLFELSRQMGVSPYIWWADVMPKHQDALYITGTKTISKEPSVKYRGIFINDEDFALFPWASKGIDKQYNNIGPNTYAKVMELLLRLRANTLWPAMHLCSEAFWANKDNLPVAKKYDIMLGSSHCEQMLRDNEWEWRHAPWNGNNEDWNYETNTSKIQQYWEERVAESVGYDGMYTLGMRGVHDWGISGYPSTQDKVNGLTKIIAFQRSLLKKYFGDETKVPQLFIPYKEVLDAYNAGLQVPEDVTLCWVDDNHGYIRQLPVPAEQARSGGNGVYYHFSYWGSPQDYLWICSHSPSLTSYELSRAYDQGVQTLWVINVGDIKPAEMELEFAMDLAWDINAWTPEKAYLYNRYWAAKTFGEEVADAMAEIKLEYYRLAAGGKPEHVFDIKFTNAEKDQRIADYKALMQKVDDLKGSIPADLQDAYFQLIEYPVKGAANMNIKIFRAAQSMELAKAGERDKALEYAAEARSAFRQITDLTTYYNKSLAGGKWDGMMNYKPRDHAHFGMPETATLSNINSVKVQPKAEPQVTVIPAVNYSAVKGNFTMMQGLGVSNQGLTVWPLDMNKYAVAQAPYLEYDVPVKKGKNTISVRCLCTFPVNTTYDMRVAVSADGASPTTVSLKTTAMAGKWNTTVMQGFNDATVEYTATEDKTIKVRAYILDPGIVVSDVYVTLPAVEDNTLTEQLIENYDFEYNHDCQLNAAGNIGRGVPCGWNQVGELKKGANGLDSYGVNQDATNLHGTNVCWFNSVPMPSNFELSQTIPASKLEPGTYRITCMLWVENSKKTTCRLFANNNVQYYGYESDYTNLLTPGEINTYAGYAGGGTENIVLRDMEVYVTVAEGEDLTLGIKTSNRKNDGSSASDNAGWFKVDYFHIERVSEEPKPVTENLKLTEKLITNYDFELYSDNGTVRENTSGDTRRYTPYGWNIVGSFPGDSYGINKDAANPHKTNVSWFLPKNGYFPDGFELYQEIPADQIEPGRYIVECKLWVEEGYLATTRLFANKNVQYYGMDIDYKNNLTEGENNTFAGYVGGINGNFILQDMYVYVDVAEGESLRLGIRADGRQSDGTRHPEQKNGWFKVDYFRIHPADGRPEEPDDDDPDPIVQQGVAPVFIVCGQSNSDGCIPLSDYPADMHTDLCRYSYDDGSHFRNGQFEDYRPYSWRGDEFGYDAFVYDYLSRSYNEPFYVVKVTAAGTAIDPSAESYNNWYWSCNPDWYNAQTATTLGGKSLMKSFERAFNACRSQTLQALKNGYDVKAILWHQGESDYHANGPANYYDNLKALIAHMRQYVYQQTGQTSALSLPFILGTVPHVGMLYHPTVEAAQHRVADEDEHVYLVDLSEVPLMGDDLHFGAEAGRYFADQVNKQLVALGICDEVEPVKSDYQDITDDVMVNPDFELATDGTVNPRGNVSRGCPYGWHMEPMLSGTSYGVNKDAYNLVNNNVCWMNCSPMPEDFSLSQTISADKLGAGTYVVSCKLWVEVNKKDNCRLFANNQVQYYGTESDYTNLLTPGEEATYGGFAGGSTNPLILRPLQVQVTLADGEDLTVGIKSSCRRNNGSNSTDNSGWFKVDNFHIYKVKETTPTTINPSPLTLHPQTSTLFTLDGRPATAGHRGIVVEKGQKRVKK